MIFSPHFFCNSFRSQVRGSEQQDHDEHRHGGRRWSASKGETIAKGSEHIEGMKLEKPSLSKNRSPVLLEGSNDSEGKKRSKKKLGSSEGTASKSASSRSWGT